MKYSVFLLLFLALCFSFDAGAQTPISKQTANTFFNICVGKKDPRMSKDTMQAFCSCTAAKYFESMTLEEVKAMYGTTSDAKLMQNKLLIEVYAPCISYPVQDFVTGSCLENPQLKMLNLKNPTHKELCQCISKRTGDWLSKRGRTLMQELLNKNPDITDPVTPIMNSQEFNDQSQKYLRECMAK